MNTKSYIITVRDSEGNLVTNKFSTTLTGSKLADLIFDNVGPRLLNTKKFVVLSLTDLGYDE